AAPAGRGPGAFLAAGAAAVIADLFARNLDDLLGAADRFEQFDIDGHLQIAAGLGTATTIAAEHAAEQLAEDVHDRVGIAEVRQLPLEAGMAVAIVALAFFRVAEDLVSLGDFSEAHLGFLVARIAVRVMLHGEFAIGALDDVLVGPARNGEDFVIVPLAGH